MLVQSTTQWLQTSKGVFAPSKEHFSFQKKKLIFKKKSIWSLQKPLFIHIKRNWKQYWLKLKQWSWKCFSFAWKVCVGCYKHCTSSHNGTRTKSPHHCIKLFFLAYINVPDVHRKVMKSPRRIHKVQTKPEGPWSSSLVAMIMSTMQTEVWNQTHYCLDTQESLLSCILVFDLFLFWPILRNTQTVFTIVHMQHAHVFSVCCPGLGSRFQGLNVSCKGTRIWSVFREGRTTAT